MHRNPSVSSAKQEDRKDSGTIADQNVRRRDNDGDRKFSGPSPNTQRGGGGGGGGFGRGGAGQRGRGGGFRRDFRSSYQDQARDDANEIGGDRPAAQPKQESDESAPPTEKRPEKKFTGRCRLFVGNLPNDMTDDEFKKLFAPFGESTEHFLNSGRGFGFVRMVGVLL